MRRTCITELEAVRIIMEDGKATGVLVHYDLKSEEETRTWPTMRKSFACCDWRVPHLARLEVPCPTEANRFCYGTPRSSVYPNLRMKDRSSKYQLSALLGLSDGWRMDRKEFAGESGGCGGGCQGNGEGNQEQEQVQGCGRDQEEESCSEKIPQSQTII